MRGSIKNLSFFLLMTFGVLFGASYVAVLDDRAGVRALQQLSPVVDILGWIGSLYIQSALEILPILIGLLSLCAAYFAIRSRAVAVGVGLIFAFVGQGFYLHNQTEIGTALYGVAFILFCSGVFRFHAKDPRSDQETLRNPLLILFGIVILGIFFRLYGINHHFNYFEGELSPYSAAGTSLGGIALANKGVGGPWAPLGLLYYLPITLSTSLFGTTLTALRISSAIVGVLTIPLVYLFMKRVIGNTGGLISALFFALNSLHIGWSRTDIHPHGVTTWPILLLCIATLNAFRSQRNFDYLILALCMALTWHQYPSGQSAVAIPWIVIGIYAISNRFSLPCRWRGLFWITLGSVLWVAGLPLSYYLADGEFVFPNPFTLTTQRTSWGNTTHDMGIFDSALFVVSTAANHFVDVLQGIFYKAPYLFHQDFVPEIAPFPMRTVPWAFASLSVIGFVITVRNAKRTEYALILAWLIAGVLPGILSEQAYPKRLSTVFPAIDCLVAIACVWLFAKVRSSTCRTEQGFVKVIFGAAVVWFVGITTAAWFKNDRWPFGEPVDIAVYRTVSKMIEPQTIVIADMWRDYDEGKSLYLLLDTLTDSAWRPNALYYFRPDQGNLGWLIEDPTRAVEALRKKDIAWWYDWTKLRTQKEETVSQIDWRYVLFILQKRSGSSFSNEDFITQIKQRCRNAVVADFPVAHSFPNELSVIRCSIQ